MAFMVGEQKACCAESAAALAAEKKLPIKYVVATKSFDTEEAAFVSLVETTEKFINDFATPVKCEQSGLTSIAGKACDCPIMAGEREKLVKASMDKVHMTFKVGKESCDCPVTAKSKAEATGEKVVYVVNGEETQCEYSARLNLARAKYNAAVAALQPKAESTANASNAPKIN